MGAKVSESEREAVNIRARNVSDGSNVFTSPKKVNCFGPVTFAPCGRFVRGSDQAPSADT